MRLNLTSKDIGHCDLVDEATGDVHYTIRTNIDGKMKTVRRPSKEATLDSTAARGLFVGRFYLHTVMSDKIELKEGEQLDVKEWLHEEDKGSVFTSKLGKKYIWTLQQHGHASLHDEDGQQVAYLYERSSGRHGTEKREKAFLEVNNELKDILDDVVVSCLYIKLRGQHAGVFGSSLSHKVAVAMSSFSGVP